MGSLSGGLAFLYQYYDIYFLLIPVWFSSFLTLHFLMKRRKLSILRTCFCIPVVFLICDIAAYIWKLIYVIDTDSVCVEILFDASIMLICGTLISFGLYMLFCCEFCGVKDFYYTNSWGILIFIVLFFEFTFNKSDNLKPWGSCWYGVDYSMGMGSRFLIGTILNIITGGKVTAGIAYFFCETALVLLIATIAFLANIVIKKSDKSEVGAVIFLILCFISSPGSIAGMWTDGNMGRLETYTLIVSLFSVILFHKIKNIALKYISITALAVVSTAIYQGFIFLYFPIFFVVIVCDILKDKEIKKSKIVCGFLSCLVIGLAFLVLQFFSYVNFENASQMADAICQKTDLNVKEEAIYYEFFASIVEAYNDINKVFLTNGECPREKTLLLLVIMMPIIVIMIALYSVCLREVKGKHENNSIFKYPYIYCILINFVILPQFLLNVDWGRWMIAITINLFFEVLYLKYMGFSEMKVAIKRLSVFVEKNKAIAVMCILYLTIFHKFEDRTFFPQIEKIWLSVSKHL